MGAAASVDDVVGMDFAATIADTKGNKCKLIFGPEKGDHRSGEFRVGAAMSKYCFAVAEKEVEIVHMTQEQVDAAQGNSPMLFGELPLFMHDGKFVEGYYALKAAWEFALPFAASP